MSKKFTSETTTHETSQDSANTSQHDDGLPGSLLFRLEGTILWYVSGVAIYGIAAVDFFIFLGVKCPSTSPAIKVLPSENFRVQQFYGSLALSILLTPAAIMIRKMGYDLALLHPFAIAARQPVGVSDLDSLMDPGLSSLLPLFKYKPLIGIFQSFLLVVGAVLVPIGTLLVSTGSYAAPRSGVATVGMPTANGVTMNLDLEMDLFDGKSNLVNSSSAFFGRSASSLFTGNIIRQAGILPPTVSQLGPLPTSNLTYETNVRYEGIVTYKWSSGCEQSSAIKYYYDYGSSAFNITFPNGQRVDGYNSVFTPIFVSNSSTDDHTHDITTYYVILGDSYASENANRLDEAEAVTAIDFARPGRTGPWISRVACTPKFSWEVSNCIWKDSSMTDCYPTPGSSTTRLNDAALDTLQLYLSAIPLNLFDSSEYIYGKPTIQTALMFNPYANGEFEKKIRAPFLSDYDNMYGFVAQALATVTTSGYYGTAEVKTTGSTPQPTYLIRIYILAIVTAMLVLSPLLTISILVWDLYNHVPLRRATFLTISTAVRGPRWDSVFQGACVMPHKDMRKRYKGRDVMFGAHEDVGAKPQVGLAQNVMPIQSEMLYSGCEEFSLGKNSHK